MNILKKRSRENCRPINNSYQNRSLTYSQSLHQTTLQHPHKWNHNSRSTAHTTNETTPDPPGKDKTENLEKQLNYIHCECTDVESGTKRTLVKNMLGIEHEYEIPIDLIAFQSIYKIEFHHIYKMK